MRNAADEFRCSQLDANAQLLTALMESVRFEELGKGRRGTVVVRPADRGDVPLVRTTTAYRLPPGRGGAIHEELALKIQHSASASLAFNNALVELYTPNYATMKQHSDQALDLAQGSTIALYSCYREPAAPSRRLLVKSKEARAPFEILLEHGSLVTFTVDANRRFTHAIVPVDGAPHNEWLGVTFRTAKTWVRFGHGQPRLVGGDVLTLATEEERAQFFRLKRLENEETNFVYPSLSYTISESDLLPVK